MSKPEPEPSRDGSQQFGPVDTGRPGSPAWWTLAAGLGFAGAVTGGLYVGLLVDGLRATAPWGAIVGVTVGFAIGVFELVLLLRRAEAARRK